MYSVITMPASPGYPATPSGRVDTGNGRHNGRVQTQGGLVGSWKNPGAGRDDEHQSDNDSRYYQDRFFAYFSHR
jgi:hypothetical protein